MWQPKRHTGAQLVNVPGALTWNELGTTDPEAAKRFYGDLFGWTYEDMDMDGQGTYTVTKNGDRSNGGIRALSPQEQGMPSHWLAYLATESCDESAATAERAGGQVFLPRTEVGAGAFSVLADPQGAVFAVFEGDFDD
jgi:predicted enzyme related to lactoylglutathione lyase